MGVRGDELHVSRRRLVLVGVLVACAVAALAGRVFGSGSASGGNRDQKDRAERMVPAPGSPVEVHGRVVVDGATWYVTTFHDLDGELCIAEHIPGGGVGTGCAKESTLFARGPLNMTVSASQNSGETGRWARVWMSGFAAPSVTAVEVTSSDCSRIPLHVDEYGIFFHVVPSARLRDNVLPERLDALGSRGRKLGSIPVDLSRSGPWSTPDPATAAGRCRAG